MITRRSLFASLAGLAAAPAVVEARPVAYPEAARYLGGLMAPIRIQGCILPPFDREAAAATLDRLIKNARSNLSRSQRDKGAE